MDLISFRDIIVEDDENTTYFFILGAKNCGKSSFADKIINFLPKFNNINKYLYKENLIFSLKTKESTSSCFNVLDISNTNVLSELKDHLKRINKKFLIILFENLQKEKEFIQLIISELKQNFVFEKYLLVRTKCEINYGEDIEFNQSFASSLGFVYRELSYLNEEFSQGHFNQVLKEDFLNYFNHAPNYWDTKSQRTQRVKRRKIFMITKMPIKKRRKFSLIEKTISEKSIENERSTNNYEEEKVSSNSLISISKHLFRFMKSKKSVSGKIVYSQLLKATQYILKHISQEEDSKISFKNIQRRVYDAINVMTAIGLITKDKSSLSYDGVFQVYDSNTLEKMNKLKEKITEVKSNIEINQNNLMMLIGKHLFCKNVIEENLKYDYRTKTEEKLNYPFLLIKLGNDAAFTIKEDESNSRVCLFSDKSFTTIKDDEVMKEYFKNNSKLIRKLKKEVQDELNEYIDKNSLVERYLGVKNPSGITDDDVSLYSENRKPSFSSHDNKSSYRFSFMNGKNNKISLNDENNLLDCYEKIDMFSDNN